MKNRELRDFRSPLAKARDAYFSTREGELLTHIDILNKPELKRFLENRLVCAFIAGADWAAKNNYKP